GLPRGAGGPDPAAADPAGPAAGAHHDRPGHRVLRGASAPDGRQSRSQLAPRPPRVDALVPPLAPRAGPPPPSGALRDQTGRSVPVSTSRIPVDVSSRSAPLGANPRRIPSTSSQRTRAPRKASRASTRGTRLSTPPATK